MGHGCPLIVVCGEALVDRVESRETLGGGPFNTAIGLARLGARTGFVGRLSTDARGERLLQALVAAGVDVSLVRRGPEPTTIAQALLTADGQASYEFHGSGWHLDDAGAIERALTAADTANSRPERTLAVLFGGLSLVFEPGARDYEMLLTGAHEAGALTVLDPNVRPSAIADPVAYRRRFARLARHVDILKLSDADAAWIGPLPDVPVLVTTHGAQGISVRTPDVCAHVPARPVAVADTIGAGDAVNSALLSWLDTDGALHRDRLANYSAQQWKQALGFAADVAAVTVSRPGADPPSKHELV